MQTSTRRLLKNSSQPHVTTLLSEKHPCARGSHRYTGGMLKLQDIAKPVSGQEEGPREATQDSIVRTIEPGPEYRSPMLSVLKRLRRRRGRTRKLVRHSRLQSSAAKPPVRDSLFRWLTKTGGGISTSLLLASCKALQRLAT